MAVLPALLPGPPGLIDRIPQMVMTGGVFLLFYLRLWFSEAAQSGFLASIY